VRAKQYVYFAVYSSDVPAAEITLRLGMTPDREMVRGSKDPDRPLPLQHSWAIESRNRDRRLDEQIEEVVSRVRPLEAALTELVPRLGPDGGCKLEIVRYMNDHDSPESETRLLGFALEPETLHLLSRLGAFVDVDEYDAALGED
jgi:Domain of unknown function (DUF4279)